MNVGVRTHGTAHEADSYVFLTPGNFGVGIVRDDGSLVWWKAHPPGTTEEQNATVVRLGGRPFLAVWAGSAHKVGDNGVLINDGSILLYNSRYQRVGQITAGRPFAPDTIDMHEFRITPQGDALVGIYQPVREVVDRRPVIVVHYVIQKLALVRDSQGIHTGRVLFHWSTQGHVPLPASFLPEPGRGGAWDYFHGNAIAQDSDGNLIVSGRNTWGIYKISLGTGRIIWEVGGRGDHQLMLPWCYQHDVSALGRGEYALFDDGAVGRHCVGGTSHPSRGLIVRVDPARRPAGVSLLQAYAHRPAIRSEFLGSTQRLSDRHVLVGWGSVPQVTEYGAGGQLLVDLSLSAASYRAFRSLWVGDPMTLPSVAAALHGSGTDVWVSWNGDTRAVSWRVMAGATRARLVRAAGPLRRRGFETLIMLRRHYPYIAVQALSAAGHVLGTSRTISTLRR
jgi:hypothetical protein